MRKLFLSTITIFILIACSSAPTKKDEIKTIKVNAAIGEIEGLIEEDVYLFKGSLLLNLLLVNLDGKHHGS